MLALNGTLAVEQTGLTAAQRALELTRITTRGAIDAASLGLQGLYVQFQDAMAVLASANAVLADLREGAAAAAVVSGYLAAHGLEALLDVRRASFDGTLNATSGGSVALDADVWFMGEPRSVRVAYDFHDLAAGAKSLARELVPSLPV